MEGYLHEEKETGRPRAIVSEQSSQSNRPPFQSNHLRAIVLELPAQSYRPRTPVPKQMFQNDCLKATVSELPSLS